ncbi:penicillin-binding protein 2, partial [Nocardioides sp.]|uniref:peptidoglycan D,D-transpeptidase FtsI family protein n=1 Tax=Nocardioides sp. TaxID=35761 RepID=UPI0027327998
MPASSAPPPSGPRRGGRGTNRGSALFRLRFGFIVIAMVLSVFGVRLVQLQGIDPKSYAAMAAAEGMVEVTLPARRGAILDRNGQPLASSVDGMMVVADPSMTRERAPELATLLARRLDVDYIETLTRLRKPDTRFQYIARRVPSTLATEVLREAADLGFKGLDTRDDPVRDYPAKDVAANLIGFMGGEGHPLAGLELTFDELLSGKDGSARYEVGGGNRIPLGESTTVKPRNGRDLRLTIDADLQWYVQRVLRSTVENAGGESGIAVVMDSHTGEILSLADHPTFDANAPLSTGDADLGSRAMSDVYEPGSVEKVLTVAALLDAGKVTPTTRIKVPPQLRRADRVINDYWKHDALRLTLTGVLAKSSNIGT